MQTPISQAVTTEPSTAQVLEQWSSGHPLDVTPPFIYWPTGQRMPELNENAFFQGNFERLSVGQSLGQRANGPRDDNRPPRLVPPVHRMNGVDANAYAPSSYERPSVGIPCLPTVHRWNPLCVFRGCNAIHLALRGGEPGASATGAREQGKGLRLPFLIGGNLSPTSR